VLWSNVGTSSKLNFELRSLKTFILWRVEEVEFKEQKFAKQVIDSWWLFYNKCIVYCEN